MTQGTTQPARNLGRKTKAKFYTLIRTMAERIVEMEGKISTEGYSQRQAASELGLSETIYRRLRRFVIVDHATEVNDAARDNNWEGIEIRLFGLHYRHLPTYKRAIADIERGGRPGLAVAEEKRKPGRPAGAKNKVQRKPRSVPPKVVTIAGEGQGNPSGEQPAPPAAMSSTITTTPRPAPVPQPSAPRIQLSHFAKRETPVGKQPS